MAGWLPMRRWQALAPGILTYIDGLVQAGEANVWGVSITMASLSFASRGPIWWDGQSVTLSRASQAPGKQGYVHGDVVAKGGDFSLKNLSTQANKMSKHIVLFNSSDWQCTPGGKCRHYQWKSIAGRCRRPSFLALSGTRPYRHLNRRWQVHRNSSEWRCQWRKPGSMGRSARTVRLGTYTQQKKSSYC